MSYIKNRATVVVCELLHFITSHRYSHADPESRRDQVLNSPSKRGSGLHKLTFSTIGRVDSFQDAVLEVLDHLDRVGTLSRVGPGRLGNYAQKVVQIHKGLCGVWKVRVHIRDQCVVLVMDGPEICVETSARRYNSLLNFRPGG